MNTCFDDVLIVPQFSTVKSRKHVSVEETVANELLKFPIISANMDTVTGSSMAKAMIEYGGQGCLHRFSSIEDNIKMFNQSYNKAWVSIGLGLNELERASSLKEAGAQSFVVDVANGASMEVVDQVKRLQQMKVANVIVGNFATKLSIEAFIYHLGNNNVGAFKVGIGGGSACTTRIVTGVGMPTFSSVLQCVATGFDIIADGGIRNSGDFCKALAAGAKAVMVGRMLAGCTESPGEVFYPEGEKSCPVKSYRGSASQESYEVQGKLATWRAAEGESMTVPCTGPVKHILQQLEGGLRSSMSYVDAHSLEEYRDNVEFIQVSSNGLAENKPHGKQ